MGKFGLGLPAFNIPQIPYEIRKATKFEDKFLIKRLINKIDPSRS